MNETLQTLYSTWINILGNGRLLFFIYQAVTLVLFYHWTLNLLIKRNVSILKAGFIILIILISLKSLNYLMELTYRSPTVRSLDFSRYIYGSIRLSILTIVYTFLHIFFIKNKNHTINKFRSVIIFILFALFFTYSDLKNILDNSLPGNLAFMNLYMSLFQTITATIIEKIIHDIFKKQIDKESERRMENLKLKEQVSKTQYELLHAKVNPHFLYNSLNSIAGLATHDGEKTKEMALSLSRFFKYSINRDLQNITTINTEIGIVKTYLEIEKIRFDERLQYNIFVAPETTNCKIPKFLLQPLVENSVKHGQDVKDFTINIEIDIRQTDKKIVISIEDRGKPFNDEIKPGYGIKSVYDKLDLFCPDKYEVSLINTPKKSIIITYEP